MRSRYIDPSKDSSGDVLLDTNYLNCKLALSLSLSLSLSLTKNDKVLLLINI